MIKRAATAAAAAALFATQAHAAPLDAPAAPPPGAVAIPVHGKANPGNPSDEVESRFMGRETVIRNVTFPTLTPVLPDPAKANGAAVIVAPGGGFMMLSMQNEGWRVARALADRGVAAFVLKYRLNPTPREDAAFVQELGKMMGAARQGAGSRPELRDPGAGADALAALALVRSRATEWRVDPRRVGMIGFSAGAMTALKAVLDAPQPAARPDFFGFIYGPMEKIAVPADAPPMFAALAIDDPLFGGGEMGIVSAWHAAKRPVELHLYQSGGHGFGLGQPGTTPAGMMDQFLAWMDARGLMKRNVK